MPLKKLCLFAVFVVLSGCDSGDQDAAYGGAPATLTYGSDAGVDVSPTPDHASDKWLTSGAVSWQDEVDRRTRELSGYLGDTDPARARAYGFKQDHTPALAWNWFSEHPIGYGGIPYVLLQTFLSLDPKTETDPHLLKIAKIWKKSSGIPDDEGQDIYSLDHLGLGPNPVDYKNGSAVEIGDRRRLLPNGLVYDPGVQPEDVSGVGLRLRLMRDGIIGSLIKLFIDDYTPTIAKLLVLTRGKIREDLYGGELDYNSEFDQFQEAPKTDAVFFSCTGCHQGRVIVDGQMDGKGNILKPGKVVFLPGMPNSEVEPQAFSKAVLETGMALIESGFSADAQSLPSDPGVVVPSTSAIVALYTRMLSRAIDPAMVKTIYGPEKEQIRRAQLQTYWVAKDFPKFVGGVISTAIKTQYLYYQIGINHAYNPENPHRVSPDQPVPDVLIGHIGQMDAFGAASGLVALHTLRKDNSYLNFMHQDNPANPLFAGIPEIPGFSGPARLEIAGARIRETLPAWAPPVPAPVDIPSVSWTGHRELANWDGNQGAAARALSSGTSATGDPRKVNVRIHQAFNPFMINLPPPPFPFSVDREKAQQGKKIFQGEGLSPGDACSDCHTPNNSTIYPANELAVDANRSKVITDVSRYGLASLVMESCKVFIRKNPGNQWCLQSGGDGAVIQDWDELMDEYFKNTPDRVRKGTAGYKANMLHGIWAQAPFLHNGSVPTLMHLICPETRPAKFNRGVLFYDPTMVGFEWAVTPRQRYSPFETQHVVQYDSNEFGRSNSGHAYGSSLCPNTQGLDPITERGEIVARLLNSKVGDLVEYLKTF